MNADQKHTQICSFLCSDHRITRSPDHPISISVIGGKVFPAIGVEYSRFTMTTIPQPQIAAGHSNAQPGPQFAVYNPATQEIIGTLPNLGADQIAGAVSKAAAAQLRWAATPVQERLKILSRFAGLLCEQKEAVAAVISREAGKPQAEALSTEILVVLDTVKYLRNTLPGFLRPEPVPHGNPAMKLKRGMLLREPYGVVGIISPWNYPFSVPSVQTLTALAAGNAAALKPSEFTPYSSLELQRLLREAGLDHELLQVITGEGGAGAALLAADVQKVIFTGSVATGKRVAQTAAARLLPVVLELGGKDPMIVLEDADVDVASSAAVWGAFMNAGQTCLSVERCYVHEAIYEKFLEKCVEKTEKLRVGSFYIDSSSHPLRRDEPDTPGNDVTVAEGGPSTPPRQTSESLRISPAGSRFRSRPQTGSSSCGRTGRDECAPHPLNRFTNPAQYEKIISFHSHQGRFRKIHAFFCC